MADNADILREELDKLHEAFKEEPPTWQSRPLHSGWMHRRLMKPHVTYIDLRMVTLMRKNKTFPLLYNELGVILFAFDKTRGPFLVAGSRCPRRGTYDLGFHYRRVRSGKVKADLIHMCQRPVRIESLSAQQIDELLNIIKEWWMTPQVKKDFRREGRIRNQEIRS